MELVVKDLTPESFAGFGKVIDQPSRPQDAEGTGWAWWGENVLMEGQGKPYAIGYLDLKPADLSFNWAERHMHSDELVIPVTGDILIYAGPADHIDEPMKLPALESFQVFRVRPGQAALLGKGIWHGAPLAADTPAKAIVLLLKDSGREDGYVVRFDDNPIRIIR